MRSLSEDRAPLANDPLAVQVRLNQLQLSGPRLGCLLLGDQLWCELQLDTFFARGWGAVAKARTGRKCFACSRSTACFAGSEWRLHRQCLAPQRWPICWA